MSQLVAYAALIAALSFASPASAQGVSPECEAAMSRAAARYSQCLIGAQTQYTKHGAIEKLEHRKARCRTRFDRREIRILRRFETAVCAGANHFDAMGDRAEEFAATVQHEAGGDRALEMLFVGSAEGASLTDTRLTLEGVKDVTGWFSRQPESLAGQVPVEDFVSLWEVTDDSFANSAPSAEFTCEVNGKSVNHVVTLGSPSLEGSDLSYDISLPLVEKANADFSSFSCDGAAHLFLNSSGPNIPGAGTMVGPTKATVSIGVLTIDIAKSLALYEQLMPKYNDLLPRTIALPVSSGMLAGECQGGECAAAVQALKAKGVLFAFADTALMGTSAPSLATLRTSAQAYGLKLADVQAYILQGSAHNLANYASLKSDIKLGYFNESTKYNPQGPIWAVCDPAWVIAAIYADGVYGGTPLVTSTSDCYCNADPTKVAASMQYNYAKQCGGTAQCMPLAISFEDCNDAFIEPLLGYSGAGASPLSSSPQSLRAFLTASNAASSASIVYYRLEFALLRIAGLDVPLETGCAGITTCESLADTCP